MGGPDHATPSKMYIPHGQRHHPKQGHARYNIFTYGCSPTVYRGIDATHLVEADGEVNCCAGYGAGGGLMVWMTSNLICLHLRPPAALAIRLTHADVNQMEEIHQWTTVFRTRGMGRRRMEIQGEQCQDQPHYCGCKIQFCIGELGSVGGSSSSSNEAKGWD